MFFFRSPAEQVRRREKKTERERIVLASMLELSLEIVEFARAHGRRTIGEAIELTDANRDKLKQRLRALLARGALNEHGGGRGVWYALR